MVNPKIAGSKTFQAVLSRLDTLELGVATEKDSAAPENSITIAEQHAFFGRDLAKYWLQPVQDQLVHLTLYCDTYWGYAPYFNFDALHFPKLKSLALGNFSFFNDKQLQWILSHGSTLETLSLDDCPILHAARVGKSINPDGSLVHSDLEEPFEWDYDSENFWTYDARWHNHLPRIQAGLPNLKHFGMGHGKWDTWDERGHEQSAFEFAPLAEAYLDPRRYCIFNYGIGPSQWVEVRVDRTLDDNGEMWEEGRDTYDDGAWEEEEGPVPGVPKCRKEDEKALKELLQAVRARRG